MTTDTTAPGGRRAAGVSPGASSVVSLAAVRHMFADAEPVRRVAHIDIPSSAGGPGQWTGDPQTGLPPDCPVRPLGVEGDRLWFLDAIGQVRSLDPPFGKGHMLGLFCGQDHYLAWAWPRWGKPGDDGRPTTNGFANEDAAAALIRACFARGPWHGMDRIRGRGAWVDSAGNLVIHTGTSIIAGKRGVPPGDFDGYIYPTRPKISGPAPFRDEMPFEPGPQLMRILSSWSWGRPGIDPHLLLGWIGAGFLGAALPWRPMVFLTGDKGTGKSTLQELIKGVFGTWLLQTTNTTAAGIYQHVGQDALPVAIDEFEAGADTRHAVKVLELARQASSGGQGLRGGDKGTGSEFVIRSAFLFSSINAPPLRPQDLSRMALLRLSKLPAGQQAPPISAESCSIVGRLVLRRLVEEWPRFQATFDAFAGELERGGMDGRGQAQFGTLLTCADLIMHEGWNEERLRFAHDVDGDLKPWSELLRPSEMLEFEDATENWRACLRHMLSVRVEAWRSGLRTTVGQVLQAYYAPAKGEDPLDVTAANANLSQAGLRIIFHPHNGKRRPFLAVPNQSPMVRTLFEGSIWAGDYGAGVWTQALRQGPRGDLWQLAQVRINGVQDRATILSLDGLYGPGGIMADTAGQDTQDDGGLV